MVCSRKNSRKNRKDSRKNRKNMRKNMRKNTRKNRRNMNGGNPMELSLAQGREFAEIHKEQHGGGAPLMGAPVGYTGMLDDNLRASARVGPLDASYAEVRGMSDFAHAAPAGGAADVAKQSGGRRRSHRKNKSSRKNRSNRKNKSSRKNRKNSRKNRKNYRKMHGGSASIHDSFELLSPAMRMKAGTADFSNPLLLK